MEKNKKMPYGDRERYLAGKAQMKVFHSNQYLYWRVIAVKSMRKIILDADNFYKEYETKIIFDVPRDRLKAEKLDIVNNQIKNDWLFEAVSQAEQAIEDLFSLLKNSSVLTSCKSW